MVYFLGRGILVMFKWDSKGLMMKKLVCSWDINL